MTGVTAEASRGANEIVYLPFSRYSCRRKRLRQSARRTSFAFATGAKFGVTETLYRPVRKSKVLTPEAMRAVKACMAATRENIAKVQQLVYAKVAQAQGRAGMAPMYCWKCGYTPDASELAKSAFCPSCLTGFIERRAPVVDGYVPDEAELDDEMDPDERKRRGVAAKGVAFGRVKSR